MRIFHLFESNKWKIVEHKDYTKPLGKVARSDKKLEASVKDFNKLIVNYLESTGQDRSEKEAILVNQFRLHRIKYIGSKAGENLKQYANNYNMFQYHPINQYKKGRYVVFFGINSSKKEILLLKFGSHNDTTGG